MPNQLTVTAKVGPAVQATALVITLVDSVLYDLTRKVVTVYTQTQPSPKEFSLDGVTTLTISLSGGNYTLVLS